MTSWTGWIGLDWFSYIHTTSKGVSIAGITVQPRKMRYVSFLVPLSVILESSTLNFWNASCNTKELFESGLIMPPLKRRFALALVYTMQVRIDLQSTLCWRSFHMNTA